MFAPLEKSSYELQLPRILPRTESGKLNLVASIGVMDSLPLGEKVHRMLALSNRFVGENCSGKSELALFALRLASQIVAPLRKASPHNCLRVADVFPRESLGVEDFLKNFLLPNLHKLDTSHAIAVWKLVAEVSDSRSESFDVVSKHILTSIEDMRVTSLVQVAQVYSTFGRKDARVFEAMADGITRGVNALTPVLITRIMRAFSLSGYRDERLFNQLAGKVSFLMPVFSTNQLAEVAMGFGRLAISNTAIMKRVASEILSDARSKGLSSKAVVKLAWAIAACDEDPGAVRDYMVQHAYRFTSLSPGSNNQYVQALLALDAACDHAEIVARARTPSIMAKGHRGRFESAVMDLLVKECGVRVEDIKRSAVIAGIESDFLVTAGGRRLLIECDGDTYHRTWGPDGGTVLGKDLVQDRARERLGYTIIHVLASDLFGGSSKSVVTALREALRPCLR